MKYCLIVGLLFTTNAAFAQNVQLDSVKAKSLIDTNAYNHFVELGKCNCIEKILTGRKTTTNKKVFFFTDYFFTLYDYNYAFPQMFSKDSVLVVLNKCYFDNINNKIIKLQERDEKLNLRTTSPFFICNKLFEDEALIYKYYKMLIMNDNAYLNNYNYNNAYLENIISNK